MAIIRKAIGGLNPGSDYLFTIKPKNIEIAASDNEQESIRVSIPAFSGTPSTITGLQLASNFQSVIFKFDIVNDKDLSYFEYQLYDNSAGTGDPINAVFSKANGQSSVKISGTNTANVFLVSVDNSSQSIDPVSNSVTNTPKQYWGRVRSVNTAGNPSTNWSSLVASGELALIGDTFISTLTAAKITSGTIGAHKITLAGTTSIIQSSNYDPNIPIQNRQGWIIKGDGSAEFSSAAIRGTISAQSIYLNTNNRWGRNSGNTADSNEFKVGTSTSYLFYDVANNKVTFTGELSAASGTFQGRLQAGDIYIPNVSSPVFSVTSTGALTATSAIITGTINATSGSFTGTISSGYNLTTQFGNNINGAANYSGIKIGNTGWNNAWVQRSDGTVYFKASSNSSYLYMDTSDAFIGMGWNGTNYRFRVDNDGNFTATSGTISGSVTIGSTTASTIESNASTGAQNPADRINAGTTNISGNRIRTGIIESQNTTNKSTINLDTGTFDLAGKLTWNGTVMVVKGDIDAGQGEFNYSEATQATLRVIRSFNNSSLTARTLVAFRTGTTGGSIGYIAYNTAGDGVVYAQSSDQRIKTEIQKSISATEIVNKIKPRLYYFSKNKNKDEYLGFYAQELNEVYPQAVSPGGEDPEMEPWAIDYSTLTPLLTKSIQELCARIEHLESQLAN